MKVLLAINHPQLAEQFKNSPEITLASAGDVLYREAVISALKIDAPDVLVLSAFLEGSVSYRSIMYEARQRDVRIILLAGSLEKGDPLLSQAINYGVYDIIFNPVNFKKIMEHINNPAPFSAISALLEKGAESDNVSDVSKVSKVDDEKDVHNSGTEVAKDAKKRSFSGVLRGLPGIGKKLWGDKKPEGPVKNFRTLHGLVINGTTDLSQESGEKGEQDEQVNDGGEGLQFPMFKSRRSRKKNDVPLEKKPYIVGGQTYWQSTILDSIHGGMSVEKTLERREGCLMVACWSPYATGKTFVAVNLAAVASQGNKGVVLVDLDLEKRSIYTWLNISTKEDSVYRLLSGDCDAAVNYKNLFTVYGADYQLPQREVEINAEFLQSLSRQANMIVFDLPARLEDWHTREILQKVDVVILIVDSDYHHCLGVKKHFGFMPRAVLVANKQVSLVGPYNHEAFFGVTPIVTIPFDEKVYSSLLQGEPIVFQKQAFFDHFSALFMSIVNALKS